MQSRDFANYKLLDTIEGAPVGELYKAFNYDTKDVVSVLLLPDELHGLDARDADSILQDLRSTVEARLSHHGLVHVTHVGCRQGTYYVEMEHVKGETLAAFVVEKGPLSPEAAIRILRPLAEALNVAHGRYIIHRAVSPASILILDDGEAKLGQFGMSRLVTGLSKLLGSKAGKVIGKNAAPDAAYLAPEQIEGYPADERSDVYALGVTLYFMLTGKRPRDPEQLASGDPSAPLFELVRRMTLRDPRKRIHSCEAVLMALDHLDELSAGAAPSAPPPAPKTTRPQLPDEIGGDPSDTLLWDTQQLEALRAKWTGSSGLSEPAAEAPQAEEHPPTDKDEAEKTADRRQAEGGVQGGYRPAFEPYVVDSSALPNPEEAAKERKAKLQAARRRATIQLIFGIALNLVLFLIALKLALPFIQKLMASSAPAQQTGPREIGQPEQPAAGPNDRPVPIPREGETPSEPADAKPESAPAKASKLEAPPEPAKPAPVPVKEVEIPSPTPKSESAPPEDKPVEAKSSSKPKPPVAAKEESQPPEKDPMKSDLMKDEIPSYYGDPNWAKKGKRTVRIVIPDWHKKKDETSDAETKEPEKAKPTKPQAPPDAEEPQ